MNRHVSLASVTRRVDALHPPIHRCVEQPMPRRPLQRVDISKIDKAQNE